MTAAEDGVQMKDVFAVMERERAAKGKAKATITQQVTDLPWCVG